MTFQVDRLGSIPAASSPTIHTSELIGDHACNSVLGLGVRDIGVRTLRCLNKMPRMVGPGLRRKPAITDNKISVLEGYQSWRHGYSILMPNLDTSRTRLMVPMDLKAHMSKTSFTQIPTSKQTIGGGCGQEIIMADVCLTSLHLHVFIGTFGLYKNPHEVLGIPLEKMIFIDIKESV
jgi:hypothetical protein